MLTLTTAYKNAPTKNLKIQILSLYVLNYSTEELKKLHEPFEKLSDRQIKKARHQATINGPGVPLKKAISHRVRIDMVKLGHFLTFVDRPYFYQDVAYGQRTLNLESGERLAMPKIIRTVTRSTIWHFVKTMADDPLPGEQGWHSGESTRLPPMWPGFDSRTRRHMWVEFFVGSLLCYERFFSGYSGFPLSAKTNISKFQFDPECSSV